MFRCYTICITHSAACAAVVTSDTSKQSLVVQILLKRDGYVGLQSQEASDDQESEQLLPAIDSPASVSNTIPELASVSQIIAPNSIDAELHAVPLFDHAQQQSQQDSYRATAGAERQHASSSDGYSDGENADPNQAHGQTTAQVELQPLGKQKTPFGRHEVPLSYFSCFCVND